MLDKTQEYDVEHSKCLSEMIRSIHLGQATSRLVVDEMPNKVVIFAHKEKVTYRIVGEKFTPQTFDDHMIDDKMQAKSLCVDHDCQTCHRKESQHWRVEEWSDSDHEPEGFVNIVFDNLAAIRSGETKGYLEYFMNDQACALGVYLPKNYELHRIVNKNPKRLVSKCKHEEYRHKWDSAFKLKLSKYRQVRFFLSKEYSKTEAKSRKLGQTLFKKAA